MKALFLLATITFTPFAVAQDTSSYPLTLEVMSYSTVNNGYTATASSTGIITNATVVPRNAVINKVVLTSPDGKLRCTIWNRKHYLLVETFRARRISGDELDVLITTKKGKKDHWKFKIIAAERVE